MIGGPNSCHIVFVAVIVFDNGLGALARPNADSCAAIPVALIASDGGFGVLTNPDTGANIRVADVVNHEWTRVVMSKAGVEILEADISFDDRR